jgi:RND family efflux transporter MFP subunit
MFGAFAMIESQTRKPAVIRKRFPWGWVVLGLLGLAVMIGVISTKNAPISVTIGAPTVFKAGERNPLVTASGYLVARTRATLSSKVLGRVSWLGVQEGSRVAKGEVLARLESPDLSASRDQVKAQLDQAMVDLDRAVKLRDLGIQDAATVDKLRSQKLTLEAQLAYQDALLESMVLRAPFSGVVTQKLSEVGETVAPGSAGGANAINAILVMADFNTLEVEVEVNEASIAKLKRGMPAEIRMDALDGQGARSVLKGQLREIYPSSNRQKAVVIVRVAFVEKDPLLVPDMGAKVTFLGDPYPKDVLVLGREQVVRRAGNPFVWVLENGLAALKPITILAENTIGLEVAGITRDTQLLVVPPDLALEPGKRIKVKER